MKIQHKFALYIFLTVTFFLVTLLSLSYQHNKKIVIENVQKTMLSSNIEEAGHLGKKLIEKSKIAIIMSLSDTLLNELDNSNNHYEKLGDATRSEIISDLNSRWVSTSDTRDPFIRSYMHNTVAATLNRQQDTLGNEIGEIFVTNRYGLAIATTKKLSTLSHSHKYWWQAAYNNGQGKIFFDDRGFDESVGDYVIGIVIPIMKNDQIIGILKCNFRLLTSLTEHLESIEGGDEKPGYDVILARSNAQIIIANDTQPLSKTLPQSLIKHINTSLPGSAIIDSDKTERIYTYASIKIPSHSGKYAFGGRYKTNNHFDTDSEKSWILIITTSIDSALSNTLDTFSWFLYAGLLLAFISGIAALLVGRNIAKPILMLTDQAKRIGQGYTCESIKIYSSDELGILSNTFNQMGYDLKETHAALQRKERLATLGQLTATVSHELRNPLGAMRPSLYMLEKKTDKENTLIKKSIENIDRNIDRCDQIIDELLDFTRITKINPQITLFDEWLDSVIDEQSIPEGILLEKELNLKNIKLSIDKDRLRRAIINAIENACHSMMDDNQKTVINSNARLSIKTCINNKRVEIIISDTGSGITDKTLEKIFEPLFSTKAFGVGLGMPMIRQIMQQHDGDIEIVSEADKGTTVILWLPIDKTTGNAERAI